MRYKIFIFFSVVLLLGLTSALSTTVVVNTAPNYSVMASLYKPGESYPSIESFYENSNENGRTVFTFDISESQYNLYLALKDPTTGDYNLKNKRFDEVFNSGQDIEMNFYPEWYHLEDGLATPGNQPSISNISNNSAVSENTSSSNVTSANEINTTKVQNTSNGSASGINKDVTALSVSEGNVSTNSSVLYYAGGIVVLVVIIFLLWKWRKSRPQEQKEIKVKKLSELRQEQNQDLKQQETKVEETRRMLREEEERLKRLRNPNEARIEEAKRKLIEDEKELMRLRRESSGNY